MYQNSTAFVSAVKYNNINNNIRKETVEILNNQKVRLHTNSTTIIALAYETVTPTQIYIDGSCCKSSVFPIDISKCHY